MTTRSSPATDDTICLFDCLAPFFVNPRDGVINWSKIPFADLERDGLLDQTAVETLLPDFDRYVATMAGLGYNAVAIDDVVHLVAHDFYPASLKRNLDSYRPLYDRLFATIKAHRLKLFVISDYMFGNAAIERHLEASGRSEADLFQDTVEAAFRTFPAIDGIVLRIGESDGIDVEADFKSRLSIRTPREARALLGELLPVFERHDKLLVFRTWTLGAYPIGDLMWNQQTYDAAFGGIASRHLIISLKYGDTDFFRYLEINPLFFHGYHRKIVELQCRREYEGMGEYPSFVGWAYAKYLAALRQRPSNLVGIYALQAGGWAPFTRLAYCGNGSLWNELNTYVTVKLFAGDASVEEIVADFCREKRIADVERFLRLLALSDEAIEEGLYVREFAAHPIYFRRVRVPPLVWVFWNNVTTGGLIGTLHRHLVRDPVTAVAEGYRAVETVGEMVQLARQLDLPDGDLRFQLDTFVILAHLREVLFGLDTPKTHQRLEEFVAAYRRQYAQGYQFDYAPTTHDPLARLAAPLFQLLIRRQMHYRRSDRVLLNRRVSRLKLMLARRLQSNLPRFVDKQGMTADVLLR